MGLTGIFTRKGKELELKVRAGTPLTITRVTAGSGGTGESAGALAQEKQTLMVGKRHVRGSTVTLPVTLVAALAEEDYTLTEVGVYAQDPDEGEILYRIYRLSRELAIDAGSRLTVRLELEETFSVVESIVVPASVAGMMTEADIYALRGIPDGLAGLDADATVPVAQMPYTCGTEDLEAGVSPLADGKLYFVYE